MYSWSPQNTPRPLSDPFLSSVAVGYLELRKSKLPHKSRMAFAVIGFQGTKLLCLREMHDLGPTITQFIALRE
jgi:hypothetical protein